jgi:hypothetical protein
MMMNGWWVGVLLFPVSNFAVKIIKHSCQFVSHFENLLVFAGCWKFFFLLLFSFSVKFLIEKLMFFDNEKTKIKELFQIF